MSDDAPKKRSWFQVHLSTAVVLMVVAGALVWANLRKKRCVELAVRERDVTMGLPHELIGWPLFCKANAGAGVRAFDFPHSTDEIKTFVNWDALNQVEFGARRLYLDNLQDIESSNLAIREL